MIYQRKSINHVEDRRIALTPLVRNEESSLMASIALGGIGALVAVIMIVAIGGMFA